MSNLFISNTVINALTWQTTKNTLYPTVIGGQLAEWLRHWTPNHEIVGLSPAVRLVFCTYVESLGKIFYPKCAPVHSAISENLAIHRESYCTLITRGVL